MESKAKKTAAKKTAVKKAPAKKTAVKKTAVKKTVAKKTAVKKAGAVKTAKKAVKKTTKKISAEDPIIETIRACHKALDDKKADNLKILDVQGKSPITNYFIIATATSEPHMRALAGELEKTLKDLGVKAVGREYSHGSGWMVVDGFDFMAHIFLPEQRGMYGIESLWKDAEEVSL